MRVAFDTSVIVAGLVASHPAFDRGAAWLDAVGRGEVTGVLTVHALAETWSVLTRLPVAGRLDPHDAVRIIERLADLSPPEILTTADHLAAARRCAVVGARSGAIFDALHLVAAERLQVDALLTLNPRDFQRLLPTVRVVTPSATVALP